MRRYRKPFAKHLKSIDSDFYDTENDARSLASLAIHHRRKRRRRHEIRCRNACRNTKKKHMTHVPKFISNNKTKNEDRNVNTDGKKTKRSQTRDRERQRESERRRKENWFSFFWLVYSTISTKIAAFKAIHSISPFGNPIQSPLSLAYMCSCCRRCGCRLLCQSINYAKKATTPICMACVRFVRRKSLLLFFSVSKRVSWRKARKIIITLESMNGMGGIWQRDTPRTPFTFACKYTLPCANVHNKTVEK